MNQNRFHPYDLTIEPMTAAGTFPWTIRKNGKLVQRSDKTHRSEADARKTGEKEVEGHLSGGFQGR